MEQYPLPTHLEETIPLLQNTYGDLLFKHYLHSPHSFSYILEGKLHHEPMAACYAPFLNLGHRKPSWLIDYSITRTKKTEYLARYLSWLFKHSKFSPAYYLPQQEQVGIAIRADLNVYYAAQAAICIRVGWEKPWRVRNWDLLTQAGIPPDIALILAQSRGDDLNYDRWQHHGLGYHQSFDLPTRKNYLEGRINREYEDRMWDTPLWSAWGDVTNRTLTQPLAELEKEVIRYCIIKPPATTSFPQLRKNSSSEWETGKLLPDDYLKFATIVTERFVE